MTARERQVPGGGAGDADRVIYGLNPVSEALRAKREIRRLLLERESRNPAVKKLEARARKAGLAPELRDKETLGKLSGTKQHQGVVAVTAPLRNGSLTGLLKDRPEGPLTVLLLDRIQDPQNLGSIFRSADASGVSLIFMPARSCASHQLGSVAKASAGAVEHVPSVVVSDLGRAARELKAAGFSILGLDQKGEGDLWEADFAERVALVVGTEGTGLGVTARGICDGYVRVPMWGRVGSLNVTNATAVVLYEIARRRRRPGK